MQSTQCKETLCLHFWKGRDDKKGHHVVSRRKTTLETREVSDATAYYMPG